MISYILHIHPYNQFFIILRFYYTISWITKNNTHL